MSDKNLSRGKGIRSTIQTRSRTRASVSDDKNSDLPVVANKSILPKSKAEKSTKPTTIPKFEETLASNSSFVSDTSLISTTVTLTQKNETIPAATLETSHTVNSNNSTVIPKGTASRLRGSAIKKAKEAAKFLNFPKNKRTDSTIDSVVSGVTTNISQVSVATAPQSNADNVSASVAAIAPGHSVNNLQAVLSPGSPFLGFSPVLHHSVNNLQGVLSPGSPFLGFSTVVPRIFNNNIRGRSKSLSQLLAGAPFPGISPKKDLERKRKSVKITSDTTYGTDMPMTPILEKRHSMNVVVEPNSRNSAIPTESSLSTQSFLSILFGDFCQYSSIFMGMQHQCAAMAATALAYNLIKPIDKWIFTDLNEILFSGQAYYKQCVKKSLAIDPSYTYGFLEAINLEENLSIGLQTIHVHADLEEIRGGCSYDHFVQAFENFKQKNFTTGIFTHCEYSYGLLRNTADNSYYFFDSHGRRGENGTRVIPNNEQGEEGKVAILLFRNATDFLSFILKEYPILPETANPEMRRTQLVPLLCVLEEEKVPISQKNTLNPSQARGELSQEFEFTYEIQCGTYTEYDGVPAPNNQHDCCGIVIFSFIYSTLHSILSWNANDLSAILDYGKILYQKTYTEEVDTIAGYDRACTLLPHQFVGVLNFQNFLFNVHTTDSYSYREATKENFLNGISCLESLQNAFGIINVDGLSYGLIVAPMTDITIYIFFDSHGRTDTGIANGPYSAVLYFRNIEDIVLFLYAHFRHTSGFCLHPLQLTRNSVNENNTTNNSIPLSANTSQWNNSDHIPLSEFLSKKGGTTKNGTLEKRERFVKIISYAGLESDLNFEGHSHCIALSVSTIVYAYCNGSEDWVDKDLQKISTNAILLHSYCNEIAIEKSMKLPLLQIENYIEHVTVDGHSFHMSAEAHGIGPDRFLKDFELFPIAFKYFYLSEDYNFAILTINREQTYAICKCDESGNLIFYDPHGRKINGDHSGNLTVAIYFRTDDHLISFLDNENEPMFIFSLEYVRIEVDKGDNHSESNLFTRVISGSFAQNDIRFNLQSRDTQCTANSVVFLAFAYVIQDRWTSSDIDAILTLGDQIYSVSYREAVKIRPRSHTFLAAHEVRQNISVNINRFNRYVMNVHCQPLSEKEYSGNFGRFVESYIARFFRNYSNGLFICCKLSVALRKHKGEFIIFDPHARSIDGSPQNNGKARIFFFKELSSLFEYLCRVGYEKSSEFTLTPFTVTLLQHSDHQFTIPTLPLNDANKSISTAASDSWDCDDNIPLSDFVRPNSSLVQSDRGRHRAASVSSTRTAPIPSKKPMVKDNRTKAERYRDITRNKKRNEKRMTKLANETDYEKEVRRRWTNYLAKVRRTHTPNIFGDFKTYKEFYDSYMSDAKGDKELVEAAHKAVKDFMDEEHRRQLMMNNALFPTHFNAFGNHEEIDETHEHHNLYKLSPMDQTCPHCGALYFKEECNSKKVFRTCCNFGEIHSELPQQQANTYPHFLRELLLGESPLSADFMHQILLYNNVLSFASLGTTNVHQKAARGSLGPVLAIEGMIYHIAEHFHTNSTGANMPTAQIYYIDNRVAVDVRTAIAGVVLNRSLMLQLENFMRSKNPLTSAYRMLKEVLDEVRRRPNSSNAHVHLEIVRNRDQVRIRQNHGGDFGLVQNNEVAAVYTHLPDAKTKNIVVFPVDGPAESGIALTSHEPNRDAMMYPLLFPYGEQTWSYNLIRRQRPGTAASETVQPATAVADEEDEEEEEEIWYDSHSDPEEEQPEGVAWRDPPPWEREEEMSESEDDESEEDEQKTRPVKKRKRITVREFFCFVLMLRVAFSPLLNAGKLTQQFVIDSYARAQDNTFEYLQSDRGQKQIRADTYGALLDYLDRKKVFKGVPGKVIVMPDSVVGSRQYMKKRYSDSMAMVAKFGKPTYFLTMTCNPAWDEIQQNIPKNANPVDHPGIVARVFKAKVKEFINDIYRGQVLGRCLGYTAVIEWQKRSLPHCHLLAFIAPEDKPGNNVDIDSIVSAEIPDPQKNPRLYEAVTTYMFHHRCDVQGETASCMVPRKGKYQCPRHPKLGEEEDKDPTKPCICYECSKHFPHKFSEKSESAEGAYPTYRRRMNGRKFISSRGDEIDNRWIVPYNPFLLLKYNCHINIEVSASLKSIKYLFKYLHKGVDMAKLKINTVENEPVYNEFEHFVDCRYLSAGESIWKLYDFPMFYQSHTIYGLPVHLENYQNVIFHPDQVENAVERSGSELLAYFKLNRNDPDARQYLYCDIPLYYWYDKKTKSWLKRKNTRVNTLSRIYVVNYNNIELYSLRLLLLTVKGAQSYEDLCKVNDTQHDTFAKAAAALGLIEDDSYIIDTFKEIVDVEMPYRIRCLFVNMLNFITPNDPLLIWNMFSDKMCEDYVRKGHSKTFAFNLALKHLSFMLSISGKNNSDFLLPEPQFAADELIQAQVITTGFDNLTIDHANEAIEGQRLAALLYDEQRCIFDEIIDSVRNQNDPNKRRLYFVDGPGGTGKTFLFSAMISTLRGMAYNVLPVAWTGIAAALLKGGRTAHNAFKLPLNVLHKISCNVSSTSELADELRKVDLIVWDEISMTPCHAVDAADRLFQDLMGNDLPFGGKVFVATGDFRQILPIVKNGSKIDLLNLIVKRADVWPLLEKRSLSKNVRLTDPNDIQFAQWLLDVGCDKVKDLPGNQYFNSFVKMPSECIEPNSLIDRIYGKTFSAKDIHHYSKYAIVTTLNEDVDHLNAEIYKRLTEETSTEHIYYSTNTVVGLDPNDDDAYDVSMLNQLNPPRLPPHELKLKENCIVMLLCNYNPSQGLCNGTRLIVTKLYKTCIRAKILDGSFKGNEVLLSRSRMETETIDTSCKLLRVQIPVKLAFAMTINKSQGQSFDYVGIYFRKPPFAHGHLYVALSRARSKDKLLMQILPTTFMGKLIPDSHDVFVPNIVYQEVF